MQYTVSMGMQEVLFKSSNVVDNQKEISSFSPVEASVIFWCFSLIIVGLYYPLIKNIYRLGIPKSLRKY